YCWLISTALSSAISSQSDFDINGSSAGQTTAEVHRKIMRSKSLDERQDRADFTRSSALWSPDD
ncbi:hypothetical protein, partial [Mesorhizobium sp.]|uniref:hypothetical protein n=1 Tax=Mesorhizobium sp. TaxID=1871066 RepID=UPI00257A1035